MYATLVARYIHAVAVVVPCPVGPQSTGFTKNRGQLYTAEPVLLNV